MNKNLFLLAGLLLPGGFAMTQARDGTETFQRPLMSQPAAVISLPYTPKITEAAIQDYLLKTSKKDQEKAKGYLLSANTLLAKANVSNADIHFFIGLGDSQNKNESVIYLRLNSFSRYENGLDSSVVQFDMQEAINYLDNLAVAIKPYALSLQQKWQQKIIANSRQALGKLVEDGKRLDVKRTAINLKIDQKQNVKNVEDLKRDIAKVDKKISENVMSRTKLEGDITKQATALALLHE